MNFPHFSKLNKFSSKINFRELSTNLIRICTFNILSPQYNILESENKVKKESKFKEYWVPRVSSELNMIKKTESDVYCLQECWMNSSFIQIIQNKFGSNYSLIKKKRTRKKNDGILIAINNKKYNLLFENHLEFNDQGDRVCSLCHIQSKNNEKNELIISTTHLTFPHSKQDREMRLEQIKKCINWIKENTSMIIMNKKDQNDPNASYNLPLIFAGDFNDENDKVYNFITQKEAWNSSFLKVHGREPISTHKTHQGSHICVDYIFYKNSSKNDPNQIDLKEKKNLKEEKNLDNLTSSTSFISPVSAFLIPTTLDDQKFPTFLEFPYSDHRPLIVDFKIE
ncbi:hypothetical protein M0811_10445 [Anaeramoeba ignava]|uniref:Endonuclease/exonuclease/phosphatase domain-containing protein n=1 Tax=Anaeramoeba ignava TaxID=1746090 RepID=A0A9Q0R9G6_ANAIG|nr:hypothetical protein M0811_10445 [Anaeramoeba ignava]